ncbi:MAG: 4-hydroxy-3-methylbut-2-enyl diphosphate reductase, partial [Prochlorococcus sp.]
LGEDLVSENNFLPSGQVNVGITSGASTPDRVVEHVIEKLIALSDNSMP